MDDSSDSELRTIMALYMYSTGSVDARLIRCCDHKRGRDGASVLFLTVFRL